MKTVYIGLGSNVGDREAMLHAALKKLGLAGMHLKRVSGCYETEPVGLREQAWFLNIVAEFETDLMPKQVLHRALQIERALGRKRTVMNGPRTIDIDVLLYGNSVIDCEELTVPHPRLHERRFVLAPLAELSPALRHPVTGKTVAKMLEDLHGQTVRKR